MKVSDPTTRKKMTLKEFSVLAGVPYKTLHYRLSHGYGIKEAVFTSQQDAKRLASTKHGMHKTPEYTAWESMIQRCRKHPHYVLRGITVCERWTSFELFYKDMGPRPEGLTLERIEGQKNYEPGNCRWATRKEQARNTSRNVLVLGATKNTTVAEISEKYEVPYHKVLYRAKRGNLFLDVISKENWAHHRNKRKTKCK